jgi:hypothetical protein
MGTVRTFNRSEDSRDNQQALRHLEEVHKLVHELARIILPSFGEFTSVWEITNRVVDHYYRPKAA